MELVSVNGKIGTLQDSYLPITDRGFLYGEAISEVVVGFKDTILSFDQHYERLQKSAHHMGINLKFSQQELEFEVKTLGEQLPKDVIKKSYRILITSGNGFGLDKAPAKPNKIIFAIPAPIAPAELYTQGISLQVQKLGTKSKVESKSTNYGQRTAASRKAKEAGFGDVLFVNSEDEFTEATAANIFFVRRHGEAIEICTPPIDSGILPGITRQNILDLCKKSGIIVHQKEIYQDLLASFDEAFLCSTVRGMIPVNKIDKHILHTARPQSTFQQIKRLYMAWVESKVGERLDWNTGLAVI